MGEIFVPKPNHPFTVDQENLRWETDSPFISVVNWGLVAAHNEKGEPDGSPFSLCTATTPQFTTLIKGGSLSHLRFF